VLHAVLLRDLADLGLVAPDEDRLDLHPAAVGQLDAAGVADGQDRAEEVLAVAHPSGDSIHRDAKDRRRHGVSVG